MPNGIATFVNIIAIGLPRYSNFINMAGELKIPASKLIIINLIANLQNPLPNV